MSGFSVLNHQVQSSAPEKLHPSMSPGLPFVQCKNGHMYWPSEEKHWGDETGRKCRWTLGSRFVCLGGVTRKACAYERTASERACNNYGNTIFLFPVKGFPSDECSHWLLLPQEVAVVLNQTLDFSHSEIFLRRSQSLCSSKSLFSKGETHS